MEEAQVEGIAVEMTFMQATKETGWLQFGGDVKVGQFNFSGLGAADGVPGTTFSDVRTGVCAEKNCTYVEWLERTAKVKFSKLMSCFF